MGGIAAVPPFAITSALVATYWPPSTSTVRRSTTLPSPLMSFAPVASSAAAGRESSRSRAIHSTRLETFGKSRSHSEREAAALQPARDRLARHSTAQAHDVKLLRQLVNLLRWWRRGFLDALTRAARSRKTSPRSVRLRTRRLFRSGWTALPQTRR